MLRTGMPFSQNLSYHRMNQKSAHDDGGKEVEGVEMMVVLVVAHVAIEHGEPRRRHGVVNDVRHDQGADYDGQNVNDERTLAQHLARDNQRRHVARRSHHEQHEGSAGRKSLEHQSHGDGNATGGAEVHGENEEHHTERTQEGVALKNREEIVGDAECDDSCDDEADNEPFANVLHHFDKPKSQGLTKATPEGGVAV